MPLMARYTFHVGEGSLSIALSLSAVGSIIGGAAVAGAKMVDLRLIGIGALAFGVLLVTGTGPEFRFVGGSELRDRHRWRWRHHNGDFGPAEVVAT